LIYNSNIKIMVCWGLILSTKKISWFVISILKWFLQIATLNKVYQMKAHQRAI
jgi:hypothetical protein